MAATTKLIVWNAALREIAGTPLANTTDVNTSQRTLSDAWDHAVEHALAMEDWNFIRRRSALVGVANTAFPPYLYSFTKPADYLRKCWFRTTADDDFQIDHAEIAATIYAMTSTGLLEYVSDHADNYDPANWPPHFTRVLTLYLASLVAPKLARAGAGDLGRLKGQMDEALAAAREKEAVFTVNTAVPTNRLPVMRRAMEFIGQQLAGSMAVHSHADMLRWHMNRSWNHAVKYVLEQGAWNFASRRVMLTGGSEPIPGDTVDDIVEGFVSAPATDSASSESLPDMAGWSYGYLLPDGFLHKIWIRADANHDMECRHQFMRDAVYASVQPVVMEYIAWDDDSTDPANWTANFLEVVAAYLALLVTPTLLLESGGKSVKVNANDVRKSLEGMFLAKLSDAKLRDAIQQEPKRPPPGRFVQARWGSIGSTSVRRYN